jgi:multidrug efflux pump subunit AcrB
MNDYITKVVDWTVNHKGLVIGIAVVLLLVIIAGYNY